MSFLAAQEASLVKKLGEEGLERFTKILNGLEHTNLSKITPHHFNLKEALDNGEIPDVTNSSEFRQLLLRKGLGIPQGIMPFSNVVRTNKSISAMPKDSIFTKDLETIPPEYAFRFFSPEQLMEIAANGGKMIPHYGGPRTGKFTDFFANGFPNASYMNADWNIPSDAERHLLALPMRYTTVDGSSMPHSTLFSPTALDKFIYVDPHSMGDLRDAQATMEELNRAYYNMKGGK